MAAILFPEMETLPAGTIEIPLDNGLFSLVDTISYERPLTCHHAKGQLDRIRICDFSWHADRHRKLIYAQTSTTRGGIHYNIRLHRLITEAPRGLIVDHINFNTLDNRIGNLRIITATESNLWRQTTGGKTSRFRGVHFSRKENRWIAQIVSDKHGIRKKLGRFTDEVAAARAYDRAAKDLFGEFVRLNFPAT